MLRQTYRAAAATLQASKQGTSARPAPKVEQLDALVAEGGSHQRAARAVRQLKHVAGVLGVKVGAHGGHTVEGPLLPRCRRCCWGRKADCSRCSSRRRARGPRPFIVAVVESEVHAAGVGAPAGTARPAVGKQPESWAPAGGGGSGGSTAVATGDHVADMHGIRVAVSFDMRRASPAGSLEAGMAAALGACPHLAGPRRLLTNVGYLRTRLQGSHGVQSGSSPSMQVLRRTQRSTRAPRPLH